MKIILPAIGSRGDVQPYIALCQGLQQAGHRAILATNPTMCDLVERYNVTCAPIGPPVDMGVEGAEIWSKAGTRWWLGFLRTMQLGFRLVKEAHPDIMALCEDADVVITTDTTAGAAEAAKLDIPWISVTLQPSRIPDPDPPLMSRLVWSMIGPLTMMPFNRFRRQIGAPPARGIAGVLSDRLTLLPISPHVAPPDPRWPDHVHVTGYWTARQPQAWRPPQDLLTFLENGSRPIAVTLGAMSLAGEDARESAQVVLQALQLADVRAVVQGWPQALTEQVDLPQTLYHAGPMPHTWLFDRVSAVVHHGGFGTTGSALRAGVPAVVVPHIIDQPLWAQRVHALGVGPAPVPRAELTPRRLADAILQAVSDTQMRERASELGEQIRAEPDGVDVAVQLIEQAYEKKEG